MDDEQGFFERFNGIFSLEKKGILKKFYSMIFALLPVGSIGIG
jgi:hypothetical protein